MSSKATARGDEELPRLLSAEEVAEYLGVPLGTLYRWRTMRTGPTAMRVGRHLRYDSGALREWLRDQAG